MLVLTLPLINVVHAGGACRTKIRAWLRQDLVMLMFCLI